jgi:anti-anti-sigma factor
MTDKAFASVRFSTDRLPEAAVVHVEGEVDLATAPLFANAIAEAYQTSRRVVVDLTRIGYLDVSGIRALETFARVSGHRFAVLVPKPEIHRLFDILKLTDVLPVVASLDAALEYLRLQ